MHTTALIIGLSLALAVGLFGTSVGLDRERSFYPVVTIVVASYYALFAVIGASLPSLVPELLGFALFLAAFVANPGVPAWWPSFCLGYDVTAALYLATLLRSGRLRATA